MDSIPEYWRWFPESRFGLFIHWGPYAAIGRGEQVLLRERLDQAEYEDAACRWNPGRCDPREWARVAKDAGMKYAVLTTRHHDGYCLWDSKLTDYPSAAQAPKRDFVREFIEAFRAEGLRIGLYYSFMDARVPAFWEGPQTCPEGWEEFREYVHGQVRELLTGYGPIDVFWFDGAWPRTQQEWKSRELIDMMRSLQPGILINNRLGKSEPQDQGDAAAVEGALAGYATRGGAPRFLTAAQSRAFRGAPARGRAARGVRAPRRARIPPARPPAAATRLAQSGGNSTLLPAGRRSGARWRRPRGRYRCRR